MKALLHLLAAASVALSAIAAAQTQTNVADNRQDRQANRIAKGEATGQLSQQESARLNAGQAKVDGMKTAAKADGKVTRAERRAIQKEQNKQSRRIARQKHDGNKK